MIAPEGGWEDFYSGDPADAIGTGPFLMEEFFLTSGLCLCATRTIGKWAKTVKRCPIWIKSSSPPDGMTPRGWQPWSAVRQTPYPIQGHGIVPELEANEEIDVNYYDTGWIYAHGDAPRPGTL